jgi:transcription termination factor Rho
LINADSANSVETTERILERLRKTRTNAEFLASLTKEK